MKVQVYFNLHKRLFSVRDKSTGRVVQHLDNVWLANVKPIVRPGGRQRVINEGRKNVHAFIEGDLMTSLEVAAIRVSDFTARSITYNPYKYDSFRACHDTNEVYTGGGYAWLSVYRDEPPMTFTLGGNFNEKA